MRDNFIFHRSFYECMEGLKESEKLQIFNAICEFYFNEKEVECTGMAKNIMKVIRPYLIANQERYENGKKGGRPQKIKPMVSKNDTNKKPVVFINEENLKTIGFEDEEKPNTQNQQISKSNEEGIKNKDIKDIKENIKEKNEIEKPEINFDKPKRQPRIFQRPTVEEIKSYCEEMNYHVDADNFFDFYEAKGWRIGKDMMKDWRAAVRTWERNRKERQTSISIASQSNIQIEKPTNEYNTDF